MPRVGVVRRRGPQPPRRITRTQCPCYLGFARNLPGRDRARSGSGPGPSGSGITVVARCSFWAGADPLLGDRPAPSLWLLGSLEPAGLPYLVVQGGGREGPTGPLILPHQSATLTVTPQIPGVARQVTLLTGPLPPERLKDQTPG